MEDTYENAYAEVLEIIKYLPKEEREKIPQNEIEYFEKNKNYNYIYSFSDSKHLRKTDIILIYLYRKYIASAEERNKINELLMINEKINSRQWKNQPIFKFKENSTDNDCKSLVVNKESTNVIIKMISKLKKFFIKDTKGKE